MERTEQFHFSAGQVYDVPEKLAYVWLGRGYGVEVDALGVPKPWRSGAGYARCLATEPLRRLSPVPRPLIESPNLKEYA